MNFTLLFSILFFVMTNSFAMPRKADCLIQRVTTLIEETEPTAYTTIWPVICFSLQIKNDSSIKDTACKFYKSVQSSTCDTPKPPSTKHSSTPICVETSHKKYADYSTGIAEIEDQLLEQGYDLKDIRCQDCPEGCPVIYWHIAVLLDEVFQQKDYNETTDFKSLCDRRQELAYDYFHYFFRTVFLNPIDDFEYDPYWNRLAMGWIRIFFLGKKINFDPFLWAANPITETRPEYNLVEKTVPIHRSQQKKKTKKSQKNNPSLKKVKQESSTSNFSSQTEYGPPTKVTVNGITVKIQEKVSAN